MRWAALGKSVGFYGRFLPSFTIIGHGVRRLAWKRLDTDFRGQTWLVTGATGGIGRAIALAAARHGAHVLAVGRSAEGLTALVREGGASIAPCRHDLSLISENRLLAASTRKIDVLVNNVGILDHCYHSTPEGWGRMYATNILGPYALTEGLLARGRLAGATIINMASGGLYNAPLNLEGLDARPPSFSGLVAYATHKRAQIALSDAWNGTDGATAYTMHPGWVRTDGVRDALPRMDRLIGAILRRPAEGADTAVWLAATRPTPLAGALWFDRAARPAHAYAATRRALATSEALIGRLEADLARLDAR